MNKIEIISNRRVKVDGILYERLTTCSACDIAIFDICDKVNCPVAENTNSAEYIWRIV
jgi:hypothetical protein